MIFLIPPPSPIPPPHTHTLYSQFRDNFSFEKDFNLYSNNLEPFNKDSLCQILFKASDEVKTKIDTLLYK